MSRDRFRRLFGLDAQGDVDEELSFHVEMRVRELVARGETAERARALALRRFGDYDRSRAECIVIDRRRERRMARTEYVAELRQDVTHALRSLRRTPGFAAVAIITLALGIGANSALFSVVHGVLLSGLPYPAAERLQRVGMLYPDGAVYHALSAPDFASLREQQRVFDGVEAYSRGLFTLVGAGEPKEVQGASVSDGLFELLGMRMVLGRGFVREEFVPGRGMVTVLDHGFWLREFGGDAAVLGRVLVVGGDPYTVIGVLAPAARLPADVEMYAPLEYGESFSPTAVQGRRSEYLAVIARARAGLEAGPIEADLRRVGALLAAEFPATNERLTLAATPLRELIIGDARTPLLVLLGAVGFVLLVACANVANLLLARASTRASEVAVRSALGAGRARLVRQLLTESVVLGLAGGVVGLAIAYAGTHALVAAQPADLPRIDQVGVNGVVVLFTFGVAVLTGLAFGALPAWQATGGRLNRGLREGGRSGGARGGNRVRGAIIVAEMALAVVLLMGAGLLIRSFVELTRVDPGFRPEQAIAFRVALQGEEYADGTQIRARVQTLTERLEALPGVTHVGVTTVLPLRGPGALLNFAVEGAPEPPPNVNQEIAVARVSPDYFAAIGTRIVRGRGFTELDRDEAPPVALINEAAARRWFAGQDPIGRRVRVGAADPEIIGIVADVLQRTPGEPAAAQLFQPYAQATARTVRIVVRADGDPLALVPAIRSELRALDPNLPLADVIRLDELVSTAVARPRFYTSLLALFAGVALVLAATGIFGVMSYSVAQRTREISIRMALGARGSDVLGMVVRRALLLALIGLAAGAAAALVLGRAIESQLFGVSRFDPATFALVACVLIGSALLAGFLPARRAAALEPGTALRES
jgi:putative ABC transport system permease protein